jgi:voltage-gated potassium channel
LATAVYWTLVTMTTLGFGDITFTSDSGRLFSVVVLLSGSIFLLVLLPFTFIQFVFVPWMASREKARAPRELPEDESGHLVLTGLGPIEDALIRRADHSGVPYVVLVGDLDEALGLHDRGYRVVVGDLDDPATYRAARVESAALLAATRTDTTNTNIAFTVREISPEVPIVATASKAASVDILHLAGCGSVLQLGDMLGRAMAARTLAPDGLSHEIGEFAGLRIAQARVASTPLVGCTLAEAGLRARLGVGIIGVWEHGEFEIAAPDTRLGDSSVLILAASREQLDAYDACYAVGTADAEQVIVIGGGRVGRSAAQAIEASGSDYRLVEQRADRMRDNDRYVLGDAADLEVLVAAGIRTASSVLITTHDDDVNIYLALYCRRLRPDIRLVGRANLDRNVSTLYRAGADDVLSYASAGAMAIWNTHRPHDALHIAEGLDVFHVDVPHDLVGRSLARSGIRRDTGCNVVAVEQGEEIIGNPDSDLVMGKGDRLVLIGDRAAEARFVDLYPPGRRRLSRRR